MTRADLIQKMVAALRPIEVDLGDERDVMRKLQALGFLSGDIVALIDDVIDETRPLRALDGSPA